MKRYVPPLKATMRKKVIVIELPLKYEPTLSYSGKSRVIATTYGVKCTTAEFDGSTVQVIANAFIWAERQPKLRWKNFLEIGGDDSDEDSDEDSD